MEKNAEEHYQCYMCEKRFGLKSNLTRHINSHWEIRGKGFHCDECKFVARDNYQLKQHKNTHSKEWPFKCPSCNYGFARASDLSRHGTSCSEGKNTCSQCRVAFKCVRAFNEHALWDKQCGRLKHILGDRHSEELVRVKADDDKDVVGFKSSWRFAEREFGKSGRRVSCGICVHCSRKPCGQCPTCKKCADSVSQKCTRRKCLHPVFYYTLKEAPKLRLTEKRSTHPLNDGTDDQIEDETETAQVLGVARSKSVGDPENLIGCDSSETVNKLFCDTGILVLKENVVSFDILTTEHQ